VTDWEGLLRADVDAFEVEALARTATLRGADLRGLDLSRLAVARVDLTGADLRGATIDPSWLRRCRLDGVHLDDVTWTDDPTPVFTLKALWDGPETWSAWRAAHDVFLLGRADLSGADLRRHAFDDLDLVGARLDGACLDGVRWTDVALTEASLVGASMRGATLRRVRLLDAVLRNAVLRDAHLELVEAEGVDLRGADLSGASLSQCGLADALLDGADATASRWDRVDLTGASTVDTDIAGAVFQDVAGR
jgi:uncharacterized protein YjbI with pentapeptide repeats